MLGTAPLGTALLGAGNDADTDAEEVANGGGLLGSWGIGVTMLGGDFDSVQDVPIQQPTYRDLIALVNGFASARTRRPGDVPELISAFPVNAE